MDKKLDFWDLEILEKFGSSSIATLTDVLQTIYMRQ